MAAQTNIWRATRLFALDIFLFADAAANEFARPRHVTCFKVRNYFARISDSSVLVMLHDLYSTRYLISNLHTDNMRVGCHHIAGVAALSVTSLMLLSLIADLRSNKPHRDHEIQALSQLAIRRSISLQLDTRPSAKAKTTTIFTENHFSPTAAVVGLRLTPACSARGVWPYQLGSHTPRVTASCKLLFNGDNVESRRVRSSMNSWRNSVTDREFLEKLTSNCTQLRRDFSSSFYTSTMEREFPLAYLYLVHYKEGLIQQMIRMMKLHYRPQNVYCIHIDNKSIDWWKLLIRKFSLCFPNVIVPQQNVAIVYATTRILHAHLTCFRELLKSDVKWEYAFNLHSTELPLATNRELVELAKSMRGMNIIDHGEDLSRTNISASSKKKVTHSVKWNEHGKLFYSYRKKFRPPFHITIYKSAASANSGLTRKFVKFMLANKRAKFLARYLKSFPSAVEFFFSTVNHFLDAPGGGALPKGQKMPLLVKRIWFYQTKNSTLCREKHFIHKICIASSSDLPWIREAMKKRWFYFLNKYWLGYDNVLMDCIENALVQRNIEEYKRDCYSQ